MISSTHIKQSWNRCRLPLFRAAVLVGIYIMVSFIPRPDWACTTDSIKYDRVSVNIEPSVRTLDYDSLETKDSIKYNRVNDLSEPSVRTLDYDSLETKAPAPLLHVNDPHGNEMLQLFPVYLEQNLSGSTEQSQSFPSNISQVNVFHLQNFDFSHFGRKWLNTVSKQELHAQRLQASSKGKKAYSDFVLKKLKQQKLPDCVKLKVPHRATPTKICVHYPQDDNFISNRLRDTGTWELELVFQMDEYFSNYPRSQLIDLGCNIGVFTLFAASMGKPVLAIDILPSNLALIQLSIAINDAQRKQANDEDVAELQQFLGYEKHSSQSYSDLITTVHNAIYSKRAQMYVYLKEDLNLGGTEVKELNTQPDNTQPSTTVINSQMNQINEIATDLLDSAKDSTKILVNAVCLDDLISYVQANISVFLKMDVEGSEPNVFLCAGNFFMHVDVRVILMEVLFHRYSDQGRVMVNFLLRHNMVPSEDVNGQKLLDTNLNNMYMWPENIFWINVR